MRAFCDKRDSVPMARSNPVARSNTVARSNPFARSNLHLNFIKGDVLLYDDDYPAAPQDI